MDKQELNHLAPQRVWAHFHAIAQIPRGSGNEKMMSDHLVAFAEGLGLEAYQDAYFNTVIKKPGSKGLEKASGVILQGHLDMVCENHADYEIDFEKDPITLKIEGDWLMAEGTTLGADNGVAIAYAMAILEDDTLKHPPLTVVMTTDEEVGMTGALNMDVSGIHAAYFLNLDSEEEGEFVVSCAGGMKAQIDLPLLWQSESTEDHVLVQVGIKGLMGGHSGVDIHENRGNAIKWIGRIIAELESKLEFRLLEIYGGTKDNVIPRDAHAFLLIELKDLDVFYSAVTDLESTLKEEMAYTEKQVHLMTDEVACDAYLHVLTKESRDQLIFLLNALPNGVMAMSPSIPGFVETSLNVGVLKMDADYATFVFAIRSSVPTKKAYLGEVLSRFAKVTGAQYSINAQYPGWTYAKEDTLLKTAESVYQNLYNKAPLVKGIHAGLEAGVFLEKLPGVQALSFGPDMLGVHSPDERLSIASTNRVYDYLVALLEALT